MYVLHVVPPQWLITILLQFSVQANLSQVLQNDVLALDEGVNSSICVWSTVFSIAEALILFEFSCARWAGPRYETRLEIHVASELMTILIKFLDKVKSKNVIRTVPQLDIRVVVWVSK